MTHKGSFAIIPSRNEDLAIYLFDGESLVFSSRARSLYCLDGWATYSLFRLEDGKSAAEVITELESRYPLYNSSIRESVLSVENLYSLGQGDKEREVVYKAPQPLEVALRPGKLFHLLDTTFSISFPDSASESLIRPQIAHLGASSGKSADLHFELALRADGYHWLFDGAGEKDRLKISQLLPPLFDALRKMAYQRTEYLFAAHSGAVAREGRSILLPGLSGSGKSTLCAALGARGWEVLSDEVALIDSGSRKILPIPLGMGIKEGSWALLGERYESLPELPVWDREDGARIRYLIPKGAPASKEGCPASAIVFPFYSPGAPLRLAPVNPVETLRRITASGYQSRGDLTAKSAGEIVAWVSETKGYALSYGDLDEALGSLELLHGG